MKPEQTKRLQDLKKKTDNKELKKSITEKLSKKDVKK